MVREEVEKFSYSSDVKGNSAENFAFTNHTSFVGEKKFQVGDEVTKTGNILIAANSKPHVPLILGLNSASCFAV